MITFSNGRKIQYFVASGALAFDGKGWVWEWILVWLGLIKRELFGIVTKSLTLEPRKGNLRWWKPWDCVRLIAGGAVNKVGLTNPGFYWWWHKVAPKLDFKKYDIIVSLYGTEPEIVTMARDLNGFELAAIEINRSCPNDADNKQKAAAFIVSTCKAACEASRHPVIVKVAADQDCVTIAQELVGTVEAMSFNSLDYEKVFPGSKSPLHRLQKRVGGSGGGVSGKPLQAFNWTVMERVHQAVPTMPLIASSIMEFEDLAKVRALGSSAESFGTIHLPDARWWKFWTWFTNPCKPTKIVMKDMCYE